MQLVPQYLSAFLIVIFPEESAIQLLNNLGLMDKSLSSG